GYFRRVRAAVRQLLDLHSFPTRRSSDLEGGWMINGFKKFASLAGYCDYYTIVCTEVFEGQEPRHEDTMLFVVHKDTPGLSIKGRSEEHTSELQSRENLVCRLLLEKKKYM